MYNMFHAKGDYHIQKHKCSSEQEGKPMTKEEFHQFLVDVFFEDYNLSERYSSTWCGSEKKPCIIKSPFYGVDFQLYEHSIINLVIRHKRDDEIDQNLYNFLLDRHDRFRELPRLLTIDTWCINSDNPNSTPCGGTFAFQMSQKSLLPSKANPQGLPQLTDKQILQQYITDRKTQNYKNMKTYFAENFSYSNNKVWGELIGFEQYLIGLKKQNTNAKEILSLAYDSKTGKYAVIVTVNNISHTLEFEIENGLILAAIFHTRELLNYQLLDVDL